MISHQAHLMFSDSFPFIVSIHRKVKNPSLFLRIFVRKKWSAVPGTVPVPVLVLRTGCLIGRHREISRERIVTGLQHNAFESIVECSRYWRVFSSYVLHHLVFYVLFLIPPPLRRLRQKDRAWRSVAINHNESHSKGRNKTPTQQSTYYVFLVRAIG